MERLYIVTRTDLSPGQQLAQTTHAAIEAAWDGHMLLKDWKELSNTIVCLAVPTMADLSVLLCNARCQGYRCWAFFDPQLTAVAFEPKAAKLLRGIPLALNGSSQATQT